MNLQECTTLIKAALYSSWLRSIGRHEMQAMIATLLTYLEERIIQNIECGESVDDT